MSTEKTTEREHSVFCDPTNNTKGDISESSITNAWKALYEHASHEISLQNQEILKLRNIISSTHSKIEELQWVNDGLKGTIENQAITIQDLYTDLTKYEVEPRDDNLIWDDVVGKWIEKCY